MSPETSPASHRLDGCRTGSRVLAVAGVLLASAGPLAGCGGGDVTPSQGDYAGRAQTAGPSGGSGHSAGGSAGSASASAPVASPTGGPYADGTFSATEAYGPVDDLIEDDSLDVSLTLSGGMIKEVKVTGHASTDTSKEHIQNFVDAIDEAVVGHSIEDAHVQALAGASKTSNAFNDAVDNIAKQARSSATQSAS